MYISFGACDVILKQNKPTEKIVCWLMKKRMKTRKGNVSTSIFLEIIHLNS